MTAAFQIDGVQTKAKAEEIARTMRILYPDWTVEILGAGPYSVRRTPPASSSAPDAPDAPPPATPIPEPARGAVPGAAPASPSAPPDMGPTPAPPTASPSPAPASPPPRIAPPRRGVDGFLDFIADFESRGNYNARYGDAANLRNPCFTEMTVDEVLEWQRGRKFSACGKYQIIRATLSDLKARLNLTGSERFDEEMQERMGRVLLERRGLAKFLSREMPREDFALSVAREWAALPGVKPPYGSKSVYAGDGVNQAFVTVEKYLAAVDEMLA
ncbi:hypothetical protein [Pikeienuella sp. HZG-20]|uniref:hypothetical protein n=1 Tax=Paludibacillus litoralis TaxID=3133267 RepID=UPI0030EC7378